MSVNVYSTPNCIQCGWTKRWLEEHDIPYTEKSVMDLDRSFIESQGFTSAPVVEADGRWWSGHDAVKLGQLV